MADDTTSTDNTSEDSTATTDEAKTSDQSTQKTGDETKTDETVVGAPEKYEPFKLPDEVKLDDTLMGEFSQLAKDANLPQDKAQSLVELGAKMAKGFESAAQQSLESLKTSFETDLKNDKELGGEQLEANLAIGQRAIDAYGSDELKTLLVESGLGKHPELVRFFHKVGQTVSEDSMVDTTTKGGGELDLADRMYG